MKTITDVRQLIDIEARVDDKELDGTDDEAENDLLMEFLDDETIGSDDDLPKQSEETNNNSSVFWDSYLDRAHLRAGRSRNQDESENHDVERLLPFVAMPSDYPLWKVACRPGLEYEAMVSLFNTTDEHHEVRSIVTRDSLKGFIYIEATMNPALIKLLLITPGIVATKAGIKKTGILCSDIADLFKMEDESSRFRKGEWVTARQGLYKGDVGLVIGMEDWWVDVLLVPRLTKAVSSPQKRKRSTVKPLPDLFDPSSRPATKTDDNHYRVGSVLIEHGLCRRTYDFTALDPKAETITFPLFKKFLRSKHPAVLDTDMPRPHEWQFEINDEVEILSSGRTGHIIALYPTYLEVNRMFSDDNSHGVYHDHERVLWTNIRKVLRIGNYATVTGGPQLGQCGWVVIVEKEQAALNIIEVKRQSDPYNVKEIVVPINCLQLTTPPHNFAAIGEHGNRYVGRDRPHPWIGRTVVVSKDGHPSKGMVGTVRDAIRCDTEGELYKFHIEITTVIRPGLPFEKIFIPAEYVRLSGSELAFQNTDIFSSTSQETPPQPNDVSDAVMSEPEHVLLQMCLEGLEVKAKVQGGPFVSQQEKLVHIVKINGPLILRTKNRRTIVTLQPSWVTVIPPNGKGDNSLLVFVTGDNVGKFCRRLHHRDNASAQSVSIFVAIVERHPNSGDTLSREKVVEAPMDHFAMVLETPQEKENKNQLMDVVRKRWRGVNV